MRRSKDRKDEPQSRPPNGRSEPVDEAAQRLATIVDAAQRAAEQVIDDAESRARQILDEAEAEAERIRAEALAAVDRARRELGALGTPEPPDEAAAPPSRGNHLSAVPVAEPEPSPAPVAVPEPAAPSEEPEPAKVEPFEQRGTPAGARLLATQMAVSGSSREEIEARLRSGFEIEDTAAIIDAILGPEG